MQQAARDRVFADYRLRIGQIVADTHVPAGQVLLEQRLDVTETGAGTAVTLLEAKRAPDWVKQAGAEAGREITWTRYRARPALLPGTYSTRC